MPVDETLTNYDTLLTGILSENKTLTNDKIWYLKGRFVVPNNKILTIEAGTIIKGVNGSGADASVLIIARGGKIMANGTAENPIIFTSELDNIQIGQQFGTNLGPDDNSLWGGVIILGKAKGSFENNVNEFQIEGIPASDTNGLYGGQDDNDNSGVFKYVSIRHGGADIGAGNEINGLSLGCVGKGTIIDHIEIVANKDDGIEFFGGAVNPTNLLIYSCADDGLDIDQAYHGTITNVIVIEGNNSDHALEIDGGEGNYQAGFCLKNISLKGNLYTPRGEYADFRDGSVGTVKNLYAEGFKTDSDFEIDDNVTAHHFNNGLLVFQNWQIVLPEGVNDILQLFNNTSSVPIQRFGQFAIPVIFGQQSTGADTNQFLWTLTKHKHTF